MGSVAQPERLTYRLAEIRREDAAAMIQLFCEQTNIWPTQPTSHSG